MSSEAPIPRFLDRIHVLSRAQRLLRELGASSECADRIKRRQLYPAWYMLSSSPFSTRVQSALLEEHDDINGTEFAATCEAVARSYGDLRLAAEALCQHPNTVRYRLRKAKNVLGMPDSPDREFAFLLGLV